MSQNKSVCLTIADVDDGEKPFSSRFMTPLLMGAALNPINSSLIALALVPIANDLGIPVGRTAILISCLYLTSAVAQPTLGRVAEEIGPRRVFLGGLLVVLAGGLVGSTAGGLTSLVVARVLMGLGTSAGYPSAMLAIRRRAAALGLAEPPGRVLGGLAVTSAITLAIGPTLGGLIVDSLGWRATFLINLPVSMVAFVAALLWIPKDLDHASAGHTGRGFVTRLDLPGVIVFGATTTTLLVFLADLPTTRWLLLAASVTGACVLVLVELRVDDPLIDVRLLASNGLLTRTYVRYALTLLGIYVMLYGFPQWMVGARGISSFHAGLALIPMGAISAVTARYVSKRRTVTPVLLASAVFMIVGALGLTLLDRNSRLIAIVCVTGLFGLVAGLGNVSNQMALYRAAPAEKIGTAAGLLRTYGYMGSILAATITGFVFRRRVSDRGLHLTALILIVVGVIVLLMTVFDHQLRQSDTVSAERVGRA